jgi:hypothetical protein
MGLEKSLVRGRYKLVLDSLGYDGAGVDCSHGKRCLGG